MKTIRTLVSLGALALPLLLSTSCATSTQSAAKAPENLALPDPARIASPTPPPADHATQHAAEDKVPRTKPAEAIKLIKEGGALLVDVRDINSYENMHAKGALHVSYQDIQEGKLDKLPKDKYLIFYCTWGNEHTSAGAAAILMQKGYDKVSALLGGLNGYKDAGGEVEAKQ